MHEPSNVQRTIELAWAAGLFEGEGTFLFQRQSSGRRRGYLGLKLTSTDEDVVRKIHRIIGVGRVNGPYTNKGNPAHWKPHWRWDVYGQKALEVVTDKAFTDHLGARRLARLTEILQLVSAQPPPEKSSRSPICSRGHIYTDETTVIQFNKKGHKIRRCRICLREQSRREYYADLERNRAYHREWQRKRRMKLRGMA